MGRAAALPRWRRSEQARSEWHIRQIRSKQTPTEQFREACRWLLSEARRQDRIFQVPPDGPTHITQATNDIIKVVRGLQRQERQRRNEEGPLTP